MSPMAYARVHGHWFGRATKTGRDPFDYPHVAREQGGFFYGLGTAFRQNHAKDGTYNFWHFGSLCIPGVLNIGAYAVTWGGTWTAVLGYDACVDDEDRRALDLILNRAVFGTVH